MTSPTLIKSLTESALTGINGPILDLEIKKLEDRPTGLISVKGDFRLAFVGKKFAFTIELNEKGDVKSYEREETKPFM
jgi:hypothetical protein